MKTTSYLCNAFVLRFLVTEVCCSSGVNKLQKGKINIIYAGNLALLMFISLMFICDENYFVSIRFLVTAVFWASEVNKKENII